jgi:hypothetical protein
MCTKEARKNAANLCLKGKGDSESPHFPGGSFLALQVLNLSTLL